MKLYIHLFHVTKLFLSFKYGAHKCFHIILVFDCNSVLQCSWLAAIASPSTAWRACASSSSPPHLRSTTCQWPTPATTCWTCLATRPKKSCTVVSLRLWSSMRASAWSEEGRRSAAVLMHFNSNTDLCQCQKSVKGGASRCRRTILSIYCMLLQDC